MSEKNPEEIGALWLKSSGKGDYMTGTVNGVGVVCFRNQSDNPKAPQWRVLKSRPKADSTAPATAEPVDTSDIPFAWLLALIVPALSVL